ncbi:MAG: hypothetical protein AAF497_04675, partial [Planctomycetota bacterium]
ALGEPSTKSKYRPASQNAEETFNYHRHQEHLIKLEGKNHFVEGLVLTDPAHFNIDVGDHCKMEWVKCFGWHYSSDGIGLGDHCSVRNSFTKVNDDSFKLYDNHTLIENCVIWQQFNGGAFQLSWGRMENRKPIVVRNVDIIHDEHCGNANNRGLWSCVRLENAVKRNLLFEDVRIEGNCYRLMDLRTDNGGRIENLTMRRVHIEGSISDATYLRSRGGSFRNLRFESCTIGGRTISSAADIRLRTEGNVPVPAFVPD